MSNKLVTPEFRGSFVSLIEPTTIQGAPEGAKPKYQITIPIAKDNAFWADLKKEVEATALAKWGKIPNKFRSPVKDGDNEGRPELEGCYVVQASSVQKPGLVDKNLKPIMDPNEIYSGAYYRASIRCFAWSHPTGGNGVSIALDNVMKTKDGEAFSGRSKAEDDFASFASADSAIADDANDAIFG